MQGGEIPNLGGCLLVVGLLGAAMMVVSCGVLLYLVARAAG